MARIFSVLVLNGVGGTTTDTRTSARGEYVACLLVTRTAESVRLVTEKNAEEVATWEARAAKAAAKLDAAGLTPEAALAAYSAAETLYWDFPLGRSTP